MPRVLRKDLIETIEQIDGRRYRVLRNRAGDLVSQSVDEEPVAVTQDTERIALCDKPFDTWTTEDLCQAVQMLLKRQT